MDDPWCRIINCLERMGEAHPRREDGGGLKRRNTLHRSAESMRMVHGEVRVRSDPPFATAAMLDILRGNDPTMPTRPVFSGARSLTPADDVDLVPVGKTTRMTESLTSELAQKHLAVLTAAYTGAEEVPEGCSVSFQQPPEGSSVPVFHLERPGKYEVVLELAPLHLFPTLIDQYHIKYRGDVVGVTGEKAAQEMDVWHWVVKSLKLHPGSASGLQVHPSQVASLIPWLQMRVINEATIIRALDLRAHLHTKPRNLSSPGTGTLFVNKCLACFSVIPVSLFWHHELSKKHHRLSCPSLGLPSVCFQGCSRKAFCSLLRRLWLSREKTVKILVRTLISPLLLGRGMITTRGCWTPPRQQ